jgi:hypothetical protein
VGFCVQSSGRQAFGRFPWFALFFLRARRLRALLAISASNLNVIARAIALTILCLPLSLADEKRVASFARPDRGARFPDARNQVTILTQRD